MPPFLIDHVPITRVHRPDRSPKDAGIDSHDGRDGVFDHESE